MTSPTIFETKLSAKPRAFFLAVAALLADGDVGSLEEIGLDSKRLAGAVDALRGSDSGVAEALDEMTMAIAGSNLAPIETQPYADALERRQKKDPYGDRLADFSNDWMTGAVLGGKSAAVWLACGASKFCAGDAWPALAANPAAQEAAIKHPEILFDQAIKSGEEPCFRFRGTSSSMLSPSLFVAFAERQSQSDDRGQRESGLRFASEALAELVTHGAKEQARALARHAISVHASPSSAGLDSSGGFIGSLTCFACEDGGDILRDLAMASDDARIFPCPTRQKAAVAYSFVFAPNGRGGINLPESCGADEELSFSLADYALAFGDGPVIQPQNCSSACPDLFSPELATLAAEIRRLGLADAIEARGTPAALRRLAMLQHAMESGEEGLASEASTAWEEFMMLEASEVARAPSRATLRV